MSNKLRQALTYARRVMNGMHTVRNWTQDDAEGYGQRCYMAGYRAAKKRGPRQPKPDHPPQVRCPTCNTMAKPVCYRLGTYFCPAARCDVYTFSVDAS